MEINERFYDDSAFLPIGSPMPPPSTAGLLLHKLGLTLVDRDAQIAGIREWLKTNEPTPGLVRNLNRRGFGDVLTD